MRRAVSLVAIVSVILILAAEPLPAAAMETAVVLFDFGDGSYRWGQADLAVGKDAFNATLDAAKLFQFTIEYEWFPFGVMVRGIEGHRPSFPAWWHLLTWNRNGERWENSQVGAAGLMLDDGDAIAWFLAVDNPETFESPLPSPTPKHPYPWLQFRGDNSNTGNHPGEFCWSPSLDWQFDTGAFEISGSVAVSGGIVFVPTWTGLFALNEDDGTLLWKRSDIAGMSSPSVFNYGVFIGSRAGNLHHVSALTGADIWNVSLIPSPQFTGIASSPKYRLGRVYVGLFNESGGDGGVVALSEWNGSELWRHPSPSVHMSSPAIGEDALYVGLAGRFNASSLAYEEPYGVLSLNVTDGSERWFSQTSGAIFSSPTLFGDHVYYTSRAGFVGLVGGGSKQMGKSTSSPAVSTEDGWPWGLMYVGDGIIGEHGHLMALWGNMDEKWNVTLPGPVQSSPLLVDGHVIVATNSPQGTAYLLDAESGSILWSFTPSPADYILSSPVVADGRLFLASDNGIVYSFDCPSEGGTTTPSTLGFTGITVLVAVIGAAVIAVVFIPRRR